MNRLHNRQPERANMPPLIYGTAWKKERTADLVVQAICAGFRGVDTACQPKHYNEPGVGQALSRLAEMGIGREEIFLQTKFTPIDGQDPRRVPYDPTAPLARQVAQSFEVSTQNLNTAFIDSWVLHSPLSPHSTLMAAWHAMEEIYQAGRCGRLGISNCYDPRTLQRLSNDARIKPTVVQNRFYAQTAYDQGIRKWCTTEGAIYQSFWTLTANPHLLGSDPIRIAARKYQKSAAQILFRALNQLGVVPLTGTCSVEHMEADLAFLTFKLTDLELKSILHLLH